MSKGTWVLIGQKWERGSLVKEEILGYYTDPKLLYDDKVEYCKEYNKFETALLGKPPRLAPVSDKKLEEVLKGTIHGT